MARGSVEAEIARDECSDTGDRGRCDALLGRTGGNLSRDTPPTLLDAQDHERTELPAEVDPGEGETGLHAIWQAETRADAENAFDPFLEIYEPKYPEATVCLQKDREERLIFFDFPAKHWQIVWTTNPIESTFATIRHGTRRSRGCLTRNGMLHMMFKLGQCIEKCWRRLRRFLDRAKVITDVKFNDGIEVSNLDQTAA